MEGPPGLSTTRHLHLRLIGGQARGESGLRWHQSRLQMIYLAHLVCLTSTIKKRNKSPEAPFGKVTLGSSSSRQISMLSLQSTKSNIILRISQTFALMVSCTWGYGVPDFRPCPQPFNACPSI